MPAPLTKAGRYQIVSELGRGSMGVVYQGFDPVIGRTVAIKTMLTEGLAAAEFQEYKARFQREAQAAGVLAHPNIVTVYDFGEDAGVLFLAMEYLEGKSLQALVEQQNILPVETIIPMYEQVCAALDHAHKHNIVHRDVKPANIMILDSGLVKVTDFGIAKMMSMGMTQAGQILGTPNYMSPEQVKGRSVDGRSDIFSLGVILYELVTGEKPFGGQNITTVIYKIINENPIPPRELDPTVHPGLSYVIQKALTKGPEERYQTCRELAEDLKNYRVVSGGTSTTATMVIKIPPIQAQPEGRATVQTAPPADAAPPAVAPREPRPQAPITPPPVRVAPKAPARRSSVGAWIFFVLLLVGAAGGGGYYYFFVLHPPKPAVTLGTLSVSSDVAGAKISIDGRTQDGWSAPHTFNDLALGHHTVAVSRDGYQKFEQPVDVVADVPRTLEAKLTPLPPGQIQVSANVKGAKIVVDSRSDPSWVAPFTIQGLSPGTHTVTLTKDGYDTWQQDVAVESGNSVSLKAELTKATPASATNAATKVAPKFGGLIVDSQPQGARITLDKNSEPDWTTPHNFSEVVAGTHELTIAKEGYEPAQRTLKIDGGRTTPVSLKLTPAGAQATGGGATTGLMVIDTDPPGIEILIDGRSYGPSPVHATLPAGQHTYSAKFPGLSQPYEKAFELKAGSVQRAKVQIDPTSLGPTGQIDIKTIPPGATVMIDDQRRGVTPLTIRVTAGTHAVTITLQGYKPLRREIDVPQDETSLIRETLASQ